jgi:hypothetical protein
LTALSNPPEPDHFWSIQADEPHNHMAEKAVLKNGLVLLSPTRRTRDIGAAVVNGDRM